MQQNVMTSTTEQPGVQEMTAQKQKDLAITFSKLTCTVRSSTRFSDDARHLQAVQTKYIVRDLIDRCMILMYLIYEHIADSFRYFPSMIEEGTIGLPAYGITPSFKGLMSATDLWR